MRFLGQLFAPRMLTILCIDDDLQTLALRQVVLRAESFLVLSASTGQSGIALANQHNQRILTQPLPQADKPFVAPETGPDMDGEEVARRLKQQLPDLPIILCSGFVDIPESAFKLVEGFVSKGDAPEFLVAMIRSIVNRKKPPRHERRLDRSA